MIGLSEGTAWRPSNAPRDPGTIRAQSPSRFDPQRRPSARRCRTLSVRSLGVSQSDRAPRAWLLMAAGDNRGHGGNSGYDDQIDAYYSWDSNVPNHKNLRVGD